MITWMICDLLRVHHIDPCVDYGLNKMITCLVYKMQGTAEL